jgi:hypothetical protein
VLGDTNLADGGDPLFVNAPTPYFQLDGTDWFTSWPDNGDFYSSLHHTGHQHSFVFWVRPEGPSYFILLGTMDNGGSPGIRWNPQGTWGYGVSPGPTGGTSYQVLVRNVQCLSTYAHVFLPPLVP